MKVNYFGKFLNLIFNISIRDCISSGHPSGNVRFTTDLGCQDNLKKIWDFLTFEDSNHTFITVTQIEVYKSDMSLF